MADRIYCLSDPAEPGLVRLAQWGNDGPQPGMRRDSALSSPGENIDWSMEVDDAGAALAALDRSMRWYRKNRGNGIYRCSPKDAWSITMRYGVERRQGFLSSFSVSDALLTVFIVFALLSGILAMQVAEMHTAMTLSITAIVLAMLTVCLAFARDRVSAR